MDLIGLKRAIEELQKIVDSWDADHAPASIEVDMSLERVKSIYEMIRFPSDPAPCEEEIVEEEEEIIEEEEIVEPEPEVEIEIEIEDEKERKKEIRRKIISLYEGAEYVKEEEKEEEVTSKVVSEREQEREREQMEYIPTNTITSQIGINDRLLLANELFEGDMAAMDNCLGAIERQRSFDDALLYIAENYSWRGEGEGAKLLYILLENNYK